MFDWEEFKKDKIAVHWVKKCYENNYRCDNYKIIERETEMSNTEKILEVIGLKVGEKFKVGYSPFTLYFDKDLKLCDETGNWIGMELDVLNGTDSIIKIPTITANDREILNFYAKRGYKWFACDGCDEMWAYSTKPTKDGYAFFSPTCDKIIRIVEPLTFLKWGDEPFYWECE